MNIDDRQRLRALERKHTVEYQKLAVSLHTAAEVRRNALHTLSTNQGEKQKHLQRIRHHSEGICPLQFRSELDRLGSLDERVAMSETNFLESQRLAEQAEVAFGRARITLDKLTERSDSLDALRQVAREIVAEGELQDLEAPLLEVTKDAATQFPDVSQAYGVTPPTADDGIPQDAREFTAHQGSSHGEAAHSHDCASPGSSGESDTPPHPQPDSGGGTSDLDWQAHVTQQELHTAVNVQVTQGGRERVNLALICDHLERIRVVVTGSGKGFSCSGETVRSLLHHERVVVRSVEVSLFNREGKPV